MDREHALVAKYIPERSSKCYYKFIRPSTRRFWLSSTRQNYWKLPRTWKQRRFLLIRHLAYGCGCYLLWDPRAARVRSWSQCCLHLHGCRVRLRLQGAVVGHSLSSSHYWTPLGCGFVLPPTFSHGVTSCSESVLPWPWACTIESLYNSCCYTYALADTDWTTKHFKSNI